MWQRSLVESVHAVWQAGYCSLPRALLQAFQQWPLSRQVAWVVVRVAVVPSASTGRIRP
jgi:hypothetical protein